MGDGLSQEGFYAELRKMRQAFDRKREDLRRYARASFDVVSQANGHDCVVVLEFNRAHSRSERVFANYELGVLKPNHGEVFLGQRAVDGVQLRQVVGSLKRVIMEFEKRPEREELEEWVDECFDGKGLPLVPIAVHGLNYFCSVVDASGRPVYAGHVVTYRSNEPASRQALADLCSSF